MQTCMGLLEAQKILSDRISYKKRQILIKSYPIGVQPELIQRQAQQAFHTPYVFNFEDIPRQKTIIGVDRIDYSKVYLNVSMHLQLSLKLILNIMDWYVTFKLQRLHVQIFQPYQRLYQRFKAKLELINEEFAHEDWRPIDCCFDTVQHDSLMHIYRRSDILLD